MKSAVILGVNGQDGSYLAEILLERGYRVLGIGLQESSRYLKDNNNFQYMSQDIKDTVTLTSILITHKPQEIYHLAAVHGAAGFDYENIFSDVLDVNVKSLHAILEYARIHQPAVRIAYASSAKVFGNELKGKISTSNKHTSDCLYSITKSAAGDMLNYYYANYKIYGSIAYFFNHDSVRRNSEYFIPTIVRALANAINNRGYTSEVNSLDFYCDWGCAYEYMTMFNKMLSLPNREELVIASGKTRYGREFVDELFKRNGLDYRTHVKERINSQSSKEFLVDINKTSDVLGLTPTKDIYAVCNEILEEYIRDDFSSKI